MNGRQGTGLCLEISPIKVFWISNFPVPNSKYQIALTLMATYNQTSKSTHCTNKTTISIPSHHGHTTAATQYTPAVRHLPSMHHSNNGTERERMDTASDSSF